MVRRRGLIPFTKRRRALHPSPSPLDVMPVTLSEITAHLRRITRLAKEKITEARSAVPDTPEHRLEDVTATLDRVEESLDTLFD